MGSLSEAYTSAQQRRVKKVEKILLGKFSKGARVRVVRMPTGGVHWVEEWVGLEGIYIQPSAVKGVSRVYFPGKDMCLQTLGWLVENSQLEYL